VRAPKASLHWIIGYAFQQLVERQYLGSIGFFGSLGFIVNGGNSCLQLIRPNGAFWQCG